MIEVRELRKYYEVHQRPPGLKAAARSHHLQPEVAGAAAAIAFRHRLLDGPALVAELLDRILGESALEKGAAYLASALTHAREPGGMHALRDALAAGVKVTGCTVHFVTNDLDGGPIVLQEAVCVAEDDDEESLLARVHEAEHRILPAAIRLYADDRLRIEGSKVRILSTTVAV